MSGIRASKRIRSMIDYLVIRTGYTSRLPEDADDFYGERYGSLVCAKDVLGAQEEDQDACKAFRFFGLYDEDALETKDIRKFYEFMGEDGDGSVMIRLRRGDKCEHEKDIDFAAALNRYHSVFGSGKDHEYCGSFTGLPCKSDFYDYKGLGMVLLLDFDSICMHDPYSHRNLGIEHR